MRFMVSCPYLTGKVLALFILCGLREKRFLRVEEVEVADQEFSGFELSLSLSDQDLSLLKRPVEDAGEQGQ
jgi:hypothetical protein